MPEALWIVPTNPGILINTLPAAMRTPSSSESASPRGAVTNTSAFPGEPLR